MTEKPAPNDPVSALGAAGAAALTGEAIKLLSERAEVVLNAVAEGVFCLDGEGRTIFVNEAGARMFGYSAREMLGKVQHDLVHHHYADGSPFPKEVCPISMSVTEGVTQRVGGDVFWRRDGSQVPVDYTAIPLKEGRRVVGAVVTFRDVSAERRFEQQEELLARERAARVAVERARAELEASEERLRLALAAGRMGTWEWDIAGNHVHWSPEEEALYGLEPGDFEGTPESYMARVHPDDREPAWHAVQQALSQRAPTHHVVHRIVLADASVRWLESHGRFVYDGQGAPMRLVGVSMDVTHRMLADEVQAHSRRKAESAQRQVEELLELAPSAISATEGPDHVMRWANAMARQLLGGRDVIGRAAREAFPELDGQGLFEVLDEVYRTGQPWSAQGLTVRWDPEGTGELRESRFNVVYQPRFDAEGRVVGTMSHSVPVG